MKQTFSPEVREQIYKISCGYCQNPQCINKGEEYHHKLENFERRWEKFPYFIQSPMNCILLCRDCHTNKVHLFKIREDQAQVYENWIKKLVNNAKYGNDNEKNFAE